MLSWMVDGATQCIELSQYKQTEINVELHKILRMEKGARFKLIEKTIGKIRHATTSVPTGNKLMTPINKILQVKPRIVWWKYFPDAKQTFRDWRILLKEDSREPTTEKELFMGEPKFLGWVDASREGVGGGWIPGKYSPEPTIWRLKWP